jgi:hypothetical protein
MKKGILAIGAIAIPATILVATLDASINDVFAKRFGKSYAQSTAINNECNAVQNCIGDILQTQGDGAAQASTPSVTERNTGESVPWD